MHHPSFWAPRVEPQRSIGSLTLRDRASGAGDPKLIFDLAAPIAGFGLARASAGLCALVLRSKREALGSHQTCAAKPAPACYENSKVVEFNLRHGAVAPQSSSLSIRFT